MPSPLWHRVVVVILNQMSDWRNCTFTWRQHWSLNTSYIIMYLTLNGRHDKLFWNTKLLRLWSNLNWPSLTMRKNPVLKHFFTGFPFWPSSYDRVSHIIGWLLCLCLFTTRMEVLRVCITLFEHWWSKFTMKNSKRHVKMNKQFEWNLPEVMKNLTDCCSIL